MLYGGLQLELAVRDTSGVAANFHAADGEITRDMQGVIDRGADLIVAVTRQLVPVRTGFMREHVTKRKSAGGLAFEVGWSATDFINAGLAFYPVFVEFGTRNMAARPSLGRAYRYAVPIIQQEARDVIRAAIERIGRRRTRTNRR